MEGEKELNRKEIELREGNISLVLDSYNDLFSDFDPRGVSERALSDDFLVECKRAVRDRSGVNELRLMIPQKKRDFSYESKIRKRIKEHFRRHSYEKQGEVNKIKIAGLVWSVLGFLVMVAGTFMLPFDSFFSRLLFIMMEPAGWFFFWEGLGKIFIDSKKDVKDFDFYKKMKDVELIFISY